MARTYAPSPLRAIALVCKSLPLCSIHRSLARPLFTDCDNPVLQHARLEPFLDQADDAWIGDPMLDETDQPTLADFVEKGSNVRVKATGWSAAT
jgi:hypothetical protein